MDLKDLDRIGQEATAGPWGFCARHTLHEGPVVDTLDGEYVCACATDKAGLGIRDSKFIAQSRNHWQVLIDCLRAAKRVAELPNGSYAWSKARDELRAKLKRLEEIG